MTRPLNPNDPNVVMLELVARRLGADLCSRFACVGGAVAGLLITDPANPPIRPTEDVDIVAEVVALSGYHRIEKELRERGFVQDMSPGAPICRWQVEGVTVDVMPTPGGDFGLCQPLVSPVRQHRAASRTAKPRRNSRDLCTGLHRHQAGGLPRPWRRRLFVQSRPSVVLHAIRYIKLRLFCSGTRCKASQ